MKWEIRKLTECCESITDGDHLAPPKTDSGVPFITISNIDGYNQVDFSSTMYVPQQYFDSLADTRKPKQNDILYSVVGSFGVPVLIMNDKPFSFQRHIAILRPNDSIDPRFLYYTMKSPMFYSQADAIALGAAQRTISLASLRGMEVKVPAIDMQRQIADILSAYDGLIENNRRQIKLLEEAAQRLYKEWFIDLHFPGWDTKSIVDGLPEGWRKGVLSETLDVLYGRDHKNIPDGDIPVYGSGGLMRRCSQSLYQGESILIPRKGSLNNLMYVNEAFWTVDTMFYTRISLNDGAKYLYFCLKRFDFYDMDIGAAVPSMTSSILNSIEVSIPSPEVLDGFDSVVAPIFGKIHNLDEQINKLSEIRDRLLPKLMSGELEIENELS